MKRQTLFSNKQRLLWQTNMENRRENQQINKKRQMLFLKQTEIFVYTTMFFKKASQYLLTNDMVST